LQNANAQSLTDVSGSDGRKNATSKLATWGHIIPQTSQAESRRRIFRDAIKKLRAFSVGVLFFGEPISSMLSLRSGASAVSVSHGCFLLGDAGALSRHFGIQFFVS
jgi:hypothetical protein